MNCSGSQFPFGCLLERGGGGNKIYCFPGIIITDHEQGETLDSHHCIAELWTSWKRQEDSYGQFHDPLPPLPHILPAWPHLLGENSSGSWHREEKLSGGVCALAWALPAPAVPFPAGPGRAAFCRCQITLVLYFIVAEIHAEARGWKPLCPRRTKAGMGAGWKEGNLLHLPTIVFSFCLYKQSIIY